jgi:hypothetical protein
MVEEWQEVKAMDWFMVEDSWEDTADMAVDLTKAAGVDMAVGLTKVAGAAAKEKAGEVKVRDLEKAERGTSHLKV